MKFELTPAFFVRAITPFFNGCSWRPLFRPDGAVGLDAGCYLWPQHAYGAELELVRLWEEKGKKPFRIAVDAGTADRMRRVARCRWCGDKDQREGRPAYHD